MQIVVANRLTDRSSREEIVQLLPLFCRIVRPSRFVPFDQAENGIVAARFFLRSRRKEFGENVRIPLAQFDRKTFVDRAVDLFLKKLVNRIASVKNRDDRRGRKKSLIFDRRRIDVFDFRRQKFEKRLGQRLERLPIPRTDQHATFLVERRMILNDQNRSFVHHIVVQLVDQRL